MNALFGWPYPVPPPLKEEGLIYCLQCNRYHRVFSPPEIQLPEQIRPRDVKPTFHKRKHAHIR